MEDKVIKLINKIKNSNLLVIAILFMFSFIILNTSRITPGDDMIYKDVFHNSSEMIEWVKDFTSTWSGRVLALATTSIFLNFNLKVYKIFTSLVMVALVYSIYKITIICGEENKNYRGILLIGIFSLILLVPVAELYEAAIWITGAFNYIYPATALCIGIIPFLKVIQNKKILKREYIIYIPAIIYACNLEQSGAIFICFSTICIIMAILEKKKISVLQWISIAIGLVVMLLSVSAIGNKVRFFAETIAYYNDYDMLSFTDKIFQGITLTINNLYNRDIALMSIISGLVLYLNLNKKTDKKNMIVAAVPFIYAILKIIPFNTLLSRVTPIGINEILDSLFYNFPQYGIGTLFSKGSFVSLVLGVSVTLIFAIVIFSSFKDIKKSIIYTILYLAGLCSSLIMGFSPTMFASSLRIFFITDVMIMIVIAGLTNEVLSKKDINSKNIIFIAIVIGIALLQLLRFI